MSKNDNIVVLFVDDEQSTLNSLRRLLIRNPYTCLFDGSGPGALDVLARQHVDILVADLRMPDMDGINLLQTVRERHPDVIRMVLSATSDRDIMLAAINKGEVFRFLTKPVDSATSLHEALEQASAQVLLARRAREADRLKAEFLATMTHELRSPLAAMKGFVGNMLLEPEMPPDVRQEFLGHIQTECDRLLRLVTDIMDIARINAGQFSMEAAPTDLGLVLEEMAETMRQQFAAKGVSLRTEIPHGLPDVTADRCRLIQVFRNLLDNARKFTPADGTVTVSLRQSQGTLVAEVSDTGCGIPAADLPHVCERFYRGRQGFLQESGAGIGLAVAREIVDLHGGALSITSMEGQGTTVSVAMKIKNDKDRIP